jgi:glycerol-3-phosphate acyltransferase PlsX
VVKSHGTADETGVSAAIKLAVTLANSQFSQKLAARVASVNTSAHSVENAASEAE